MGERGIDRRGEVDDTSNTHEFWVRDEVMRPKKGVGERGRMGDGKEGLILWGEK